MSHFLTIVLVDKSSLRKDGADIKGVVEEILAPFDGNLPVEQDEDGNWYNPNAHWDWWRIGGRWDGVVATGEHAPSDDGGFNFDGSHETLELNSAPVERVLADLEHRLPFAIVTPSGDWHERGAMGWWGIVADEKPGDTWRDEARAVLRKFHNCLAVGVDCHI